MKNRFFLISFLFIAGNSVQAHNSLFFTQSEINQIHENQPSFLEGGKPLLSGILYSDPNQWTVWINGKPIRSENTQELEVYLIKRVTPEEVELVFDRGETLILRLYEIK